MAEYIEREAMVKASCERCNGEDVPCDKEHCLLMEVIYSIPAADVRPVVRCKECKHYEQLDLFRNSPVWSGMCRYWNSHATREDGFCFKAAKREES